MILVLWHHALFAANRGCFTETVYVEAWCDMQIHEALWKVLYVMKCSLGVLSVMLGGVIFLSISGILKNQFF